ncbi:hypothetical protein QTG56_11305 [Rossellomorea sp. AcN35-11]|nr:hypothetical protein [Rossellomorea aquimaris]WJV31452.1 hypothetical protein QTG56_11305 [Rossellomorea sp. AcN35-11]
MFMKVYQYHIQPDRVDEYLAIQDKVSDIYGRYSTVQTLYLNSRDDATKWMEILKYEDEEQFEKSMDKINEQEEIQELFKAFQSLLVRDQKEIREEVFHISGPSIKG